MDAWETLLRDSLLHPPDFDAWEHLNAQGNGGGLIEIEPNHWQMISIPIKHGYWDSVDHRHIHDLAVISTVKNYIIDQLEDIYAAPAGDMIEIINTYIKNDHRMWSYVCGVTNDSSEHNFPLSYNDNGKEEYCGLWIKSIHSVPFTIGWGIP